MKTILMTISRGAIAKNIFHTGIADLLRAQEVRLVFLTPAWNDPHFLATFSGPNTHFEPLPRAQWGMVDTLLIGLAKGLVYNASTALIDRYGVYDPSETNVVRYWMKKFFFVPLSQLRWLRTLVRAIDRALTIDPAVVALFETYKPDLVYSTNPSESDDAAVLKVARRLGVKSACMPKSWDNLSKLSFRGKADRLLAWSAFVEEEAITFQNYKKEEIVITGIPHFDIYVQNPERKKKEDFFAQIGADPAKRLVLFGSEGQVSVRDGDIVEDLVGFMRAGTLGAPCQLFIRPYLSFPDDEKKFTRFQGLPDVIIDRWFTPTQALYDHWDYSRAQYLFMADLLHYADVMVTSMSTLTLDASANNLPVINIAYDGHETKPYAESMTRYYDTEHYKAVVKTGAPLLVHNAEELRQGVCAALSHPQTGADGRQRLVEYFCAPLDGRAAARVAAELLVMSGATV